MKVLVTAASKHGATAEIAHAISATLQGHDVEATVVPIDEVKSLDGFDAVVAGSAVYAGRWLKPARHFLEEHQDELKDRMVWLFSSGPVGDPPKPAGDSPEVAELKSMAGAREHKIFSGSIDPTRLSFPERALVTALRGPTGDFRDFDEIRGWAADIAAAVRA